MSAYDQSTHSHQRSGNHRPRYYDDDLDDEYALPPPRPRDREGRSSRRPPGQAPAPVRDENIPPPPLGMPPQDAFGSAVPPPPLPMPAPTYQQQDTQRRPSILIDPDETTSQRERRRSSRSRSNVRLQVSSADDESDYDDRARGGAAKRPALRRRRSLDLEQKTTDENRRFRTRRDDYESDEGETLRRNKPSSRSDRRPRTRGYDDDGFDNGYPLERNRSLKDKVIDKLTLPLRGKSRDSDDGGFEYGAAPIAAGAAAGAAAAAASARPRLRGYDTDPEMPRRGNTVNYGRDGRRPRRDEYYNEDRHVRPPRPRSTIFDDRDYRSDRRSGRDRYNDDYDDDYDGRHRRRDDGYRSGGERHRNSLRPPPRPTQDPYYSDYRDDRDYRRDRDRRDRDRGRSDRYGRDRYDDYYRDRDMRSRGKDNGWQKEAGAAFMAYAMPYIKKEGPRLIRKELQKFMDKRGGGA